MTVAQLRAVLAYLPDDAQVEMDPCSEDGPIEIGGLIPRGGAVLLIDPGHPCINISIRSPDDLSAVDRLVGKVAWAG